MINRYTNITMKKKHIICLSLVFFILVLILLVEIFTRPQTTEEMVEGADKYILENEFDNPPLTFTQDGCSLFIDGFFGHDFSEACLSHDIKYWAGGSKEERKLADVALREDISHTGPLGPVIAPIMYAGVRVFGDSFITRAVDANWGYGWDE